MYGLKNLRYAKSKTLWELRQKVIQGVFQEGQTRISIARKLGIGYSTVRLWCKSYQQQSLEGLKPRKRGRKKHQPLLKRSGGSLLWNLLQEQEENHPKKARWWTLREVRQLLQVERDIHRSLSQIRRYFRAWGCLREADKVGADSMHRLSKGRVLQIRYNHRQTFLVKALPIG
ncbi:MAG: helix-turn-helix domain-containing protein [Salibacteraceae bacterium]